MGSMLSFPGKSHTGPLPPLTEREQLLRVRLATDVAHLAGMIGERRVGVGDTMAASAEFIHRAFSISGRWITEEPFEVRGQRCENLWYEIPGTDRAAEIIVVGAHYDTVADCPGANDNGSGVAALISLMRLLRDSRPSRTLRFVAFANEEAPYFGDEHSMGSWIHARGCRGREENIVAMLSLETIGYYSDAPGSQHYPPPLGSFYPSEGNFIGFVGDWGSRQLVIDVIAAFRRLVAFPSEGAALPANVPGVGWSDHWAFWQEGYAALMVTDTAPFRYPYYHTPDDTADKLDYDRMARVVAGLAEVLALMAGGVAAT